MFQTCLDCGSLSAHTHQYPTLCSNTFGLRFCVCVQTSVYSPLTKHVGLWFLVAYKHRLHSMSHARLECGSMFAYTHQFPALCFKHVWIMVPCLGTSICLLLPWSNTFGFGSLLCTSISLHPCPKHVLIMVPGLRTHQSSALCFECVWMWIRVCAHASVSSLVQTRLVRMACLFASISVETKRLRKCRMFRGVGMVMDTSTVA